MSTSIVNPPTPVALARRLDSFPEVYCSEFACAEDIARRHVLARAANEMAEIHAAVSSLRGGVDVAPLADALVRCWATRFSGLTAREAVPYKYRLAFYRIYARFAADFCALPAGESMLTMARAVAKLGETWRQQPLAPETWARIAALREAHATFSGLAFEITDPAIGARGVVVPDMARGGRAETGRVRAGAQFVEAGEFLFFNAERVRILAAYAGLDCAVSAPTEPGEAVWHAVQRVVDECRSLTFGGQCLEFVTGDAIMAFLAPVGSRDRFLRREGVSYASYSEVVADTMISIPERLDAPFMQAVDTIVDEWRAAPDDPLLAVTVFLAVVFALDNGRTQLRGLAESSFVVVEAHVHDMQLPEPQFPQVVAAMGSWFVRGTNGTVFKADGPMAALYIWSQTCGRANVAEFFRSASSKRRRIDGQREGNLLDAGR